MSDSVFELQLQKKKVSLFKNVLEATSELFSTAYFVFSDAGFELQAMDSRSVTCVVLFLSREAFAHYHCNRGLSLGLNLTSMVRAFRCANEDDDIIIKLDFDDIFCCKFKSTDGDISDFEFEFMDIDGIDDLPLPLEVSKSMESEYKARISMPSDKFVGICQKLSTIVDNDNVVLLTVDGDGVIFYIQGKTGNLSFLLKKTQIDDKDLELKEPVSVSLDLTLMNSFSKASALSRKVTISLYSDKPAVFEYKIGEEIGDVGYLRYYLPPMVEDKMQDKGHGTAKDDKMQTVGEMKK